MSDQAKCSAHASDKASDAAEPPVKTWRVTAWVGMVTWEVNAGSEDDAITDAINDPAFVDAVLDAATWEAVEVEA